MVAAAVVTYVQGAVMCVVVCGVVIVVVPCAACCMVTNLWEQEDLLTGILAFA